MYTYDADNFKNIFEQSFTWVAGFMRNVGRYASKTALIDPLKEESWTYQQLNKNVNKLANALAEKGVGKNDVVFYQLYNSPQFVFCYIAPQKLGAINSPVNFNLSAGETARLIDRDEPKAYIYDCEFREMAYRALELCKKKPDVVIAVNYRGSDITLPAGHIFFDDFVEGASDEEPEADFTPDMYSEVTRLCTSGTTGTPKGVPVNNVNEVLSAHDCIMHFPLTPSDVTMNMTPWFHRGGLHSGGPVPTLYAGGTLVTLRIFSAKACMDAVEKYGVTFLIGVPSALTNLAAREEKHPIDFSKVKGIVTMGSPLEKAECIRFRKVLTENIFNGYGTTETFWNTFLRPEDLPDMAGSAGRACTGDDVRIVKIYEDRKAEPEDVVSMDGQTQGEIIIYSCEKSSLCYVKNPEQTEEKYYKGWYYTKDIGTWNEEGFVTVCGRKDDMIISRGENIYPPQVEEILNRHPKVKDSMVTGVFDKSRGESVVAYIIPSDSTLTVQEINHYMAESDDLPGYMCPRFYVFTDALPYNSTGKKQHVVLKSQAAEDAAAGKLLRP